MERHRHAWPVVVATFVMLLALSSGEATRAAQPTAIAKETKRIAVPGMGKVAVVGGAVWATDEAGTALADRPVPRTEWSPGSRSPRAPRSSAAHSASAPCG